MTWPIPTLPTNFANATSQYDNHPQAHNALADAINELAARWDALPRGLVGYAEITAAQNNLPSGVMNNITGLSVSFTAVAGRKYLALAQASLFQNTSGSTVNFTLRYGDNSFIIDMPMPAGANSFVAPPMIGRVISPSAGSTTVKVTCFTAVGTINVNATPNLPSWLLVEDIGKV